MAEPVPGGSDVSADLSMRGVGSSKAITAVAEFWCVIAEPSPRRHRRFARGLVALPVAGAGVSVAANAEAREKVPALLGRNDAKTVNQP
jgi:hypothetical protein